MLNARRQATKDDRGAKNVTALIRRRTAPILARLTIGKPALIRNPFDPLRARAADPAPHAVPWLRAFLVSPAFPSWARPRDSVGRSPRLPRSVGCVPARCLDVVPLGGRYVARRRFPRRSRLLDFDEHGLAIETAIIVHLIRIVMRLSAVHSFVTSMR